MKKERNQNTQYRIAVTIAAYNESTSIFDVVKSIPKKLADIGKITVIVIDDGSIDATAIEAKKAGAIVLRHIINRGQGAALKTGFDFCLSQEYDIVVSFDADGQHEPSEIYLLVTTLITRDVDVVLGSRFLGINPKDMPWLRRAVLKIGVFYTRILSRVKITDTHNGFRAFRAPALRKIIVVQDRMEHASEIIDQIGRHKLRFCEVPVTITYSDYSQRKGQTNSNALRIAGKMIMHKIIR